MFGNFKNFGLAMSLALFLHMPMIQTSHICIRGTSLHKSDASECIFNFFNEKSISCKSNATHTQS